MPSADCPLSTHSMASLPLLAGLLTLLGVGGEFERVLEVSAE